MQPHFTLHSHVFPANTPAPHSHLYFGYKLPVWHVPLGLASVAAQDRATLHIHSRLGQVYKRALVVLPSSPHQRAFVCGACIGTAQVGISLVSLFNPLFKRSRLHCFNIFKVILVTHKNMMTISVYLTYRVYTAPRYATIPKLTCSQFVSVLLNI